MIYFDLLVIKHSNIIQSFTFKVYMLLERNHVSQDVYKPIGVDDVVVISQLVTTATTKIANE